MSVHDNGECDCDECCGEVDGESVENFKPSYRSVKEDIQPGTPEQQAEWIHLVHTIFDVDHPGLKSINMPAAITMVAQKIPGLRPENYFRVTEQIRMAITASPDFELRKGKNGGIFRTEACGPKKTAPIPVESPFHLAPATKPAMAPASNNYVCPSCKNDKTSLAEGSCWKCGHRY